MNEKYEVIGFERVDYTSKKTGLPVKGYRFYMTFSGDKISGLGCQSEYVSDADMSGYTPVVGDTVKFVYNRWGRVIGVELV